VSSFCRGQATVFFLPTNLIKKVMNNIFKQYIQNALESATVKISTSTGFKGTGFFITKEGYILTAWHCVKGQNARII